MQHDIRQGDWVVARPDVATTITGRLVGRDPSGLAAIRLTSGQELLVTCALERAPEHVIRKLEGLRRVPRVGEDIEVLVGGEWWGGELVEIRCGDTLHIQIGGRVVGVLIDDDGWREVLG